MFKFFIFLSFECVDKKTAVRDHLRIASSTLDVFCTSFINPAVKHLISPGDGCHKFGAVGDIKDTLFGVGA